MSTIVIEGMQFYSHHGYYKEEQILGGKFTVDVFIEANLQEAALTDDLTKTINYESIYRLTKQEMEIHAHLIEHVCHRILQKVKSEYPHIQKLRVRVSKYHPPMKGHVERVFVELEE
ncbi:MAG: dihydroneopterin aldolase [Chitinophagales bacterium]|nr:dihydroneopterin aldolase [Chitinophagales bacterium]